MKTRAAWWLLMVLTTASGCASLYPHRLDDTLAAFHDDLRWGRPEWAQRAMAQPLQADFQARHAQWSERVRIVDIDVEPSRVREGNTYVRARYTWSFVDEAELRDTVVETRWKPGVTNWACDEERVVSGDPRLFSRPEPAAAPARASAPSNNAARSTAVRGAI